MIPSKNDLSVWEKRFSLVRFSESWMLALTQTQRERWINRKIDSTDFDQTIYHSVVRDLISGSEVIYIWPARRQDFGIKLFT